MPNPPFALIPDRWLVCSAAVYRAIVGRWSADAAADSLIRLRVDTGMIEAVDPDALAQRLATLARSRPRPGPDQPLPTVRIVVEECDDDALDRLEAWADDFPELDLRLHAWREGAGPVELMQTLATPEDALLRRWRQDAACPVIELDAAHATQIPAPRPSWIARYRVGVARWQREARDAHGGEFDSLYGNWLSAVWSTVRARAAALVAGRLDAKPEARPDSKPEADSPTPAWVRSASFNPPSPASFEWTAASPSPPVLEPTSAASPKDEIAAPAASSAGDAGAGPDLSASAPSQGVRDFGNAGFAVILRADPRAAASEQVLASAADPAAKIIGAWVSRSADDLGEDNAAISLVAVAGADERLLWRVSFPLPPAAMNPAPRIGIAAAGNQAGSTATTVWITLDQVVTDAGSVAAPAAAAEADAMVEAVAEGAAHTIYTVLSGTVDLASPGLANAPGETQEIELRFELSAPR
jgi:hypothetical protein